MFNIISVKPEPEDTGVWITKFQLKPGSNPVRTAPQKFPVNGEKFVRIPLRNEQGFESMKLLVQVQGQCVVGNLWGNLFPSRLVYGKTSQRPETGFPLSLGRNTMVEIKATPVDRRLEGNTESLILENRDLRTVRFLGRKICTWPIAYPL